MPRLVPALLLCGIAAAQTCLYIPDNAANAGTCNLSPFDDAAGSASQTNQKYQLLVPASLISAVPLVIREIGFPPCGTGLRAFNSLTIKMDHFAGTALSTTFASNLSASAATVFSGKDFIWYNTADTWMPVGLQQAFVFIPQLGNLVIDLEVFGVRTLAPSANGFRRSSTLNRILAFGWPGTVPPAIGTSDLAGIKIQICTDAAIASGFGIGCQGSNNLTPTLSYTGAPKLGTTTFSIGLAQGKALAPAYLIHS